MPTNRVVALTTALLTLVLAALPVLADMDWTSTAGIVAGIIAVLGIVNRWLAGWSNWEIAEVTATEPPIDTGHPEVRVPQTEHSNLA